MAKQFIHAYCFRFDIKPEFLRRKFPTENQNFDAIIIGAGMGGLTAATILCKFGYEVCVVEMDARPGGYLAGFRRKDFRFDSAIHWLNQCGPNGSVTKVFDILGNDYPIAKPQQRIKRYIGKNFDYLLTNKPDEWRDQLIREFPHEEKGILKFFAAAKKIGRSFDNASNFQRSPESMNLFEKAQNGIRKLKFALPFLKYIRFSGEKGIRKGLNTFFKDPKLHRIFCSEPDLLSCLVPIGWAYYGDYQFPPEGGSQVFPEWMCHIIEKLGSQVRYQHKVTEILLDGDHCKGIKVDSKHMGTYEIYSDTILAACDL